MSTYRRSKYIDYGASNTPTYHAGPLASSAASLTRTNYAPPITSLVNGSSLPIVASSAATIAAVDRLLTSSAGSGSSKYTSSASAIAHQAATGSRYTSYSSPKLTGSLLSSRAGPTSSVVTSTFSTRSPRLQSYLSARDGIDSKYSSAVKTSGSNLSSSTGGTSSWRSRPEIGSGLGDGPTSRSRSYSHSYSARHGGGGIGDEPLYRGRSTSAIRDTSPYDAERDRDLVMSMRSQSAMSSRATSRDRSTSAYYKDTSATSAFMDDPLLASTSYARQLTTDMNSLTSYKPSGVGASGHSVMAAAGLVAAGQADPSALAISAAMKKYGSDESFTETNWLNNLRVSAGMEPIPVPASNSASKASLAYEAISTLPRMLRSNSSQDLRDIELAARGITPPLNKGGGGPNTAGGGGGRDLGSSRPRHQTLPYGVAASDLLGSRGGVAGSGINPFVETSGMMNGTDGDFLVARVPSREGDVYDVRGFESDMSAAIANARVS